VRERWKISDFAQDGGQIAWTGGKGCGTVRLRAASAGKAAVIDDLDGGDGCFDSLDAFTVAGRRVLWGGFEDCCINGYGGVFLATPGKKPKNLLGIGQNYWSWGDFLTGASGDAMTLVFALTTIDLSPGKELDPFAEDRWHCLPGDPCTWELKGGGVWRVVGRTAMKIPGISAAVLVAASGGRVVVVPTERRLYPGPCSDEKPIGCPAAPRAAVGGSVEVRDVHGGGMISSFRPSGRVTAVALDWPLAAALTKLEGHAFLETYDARTGAPRLRTAVPAQTANELDIVDANVLFRVGRDVRMLNSVTRRVVRVAGARSTPIGLSVEGRRIAWGENIKGHGVVRQARWR
jgi:hypothetical protein